VTPTVTPTRTATPTATSAGAICVLGFGQIGLHNEAELRGISDTAGNYKLCANITLTTAITPLLNGQPFTGTLDGNGYAISGLEMRQPNQMLLGLFSVVARSASISHLTLINPQVQGGAVLGSVTGINGGSISVDVVGGNIAATSGIAGGIAGINSGGALSGSSTAEVIVGGTTMTGDTRIGLNGP
jgi:hypothetical protein